MSSHITAQSNDEEYISALKDQAKTAYKEHLQKRLAILKAVKSRGDHVVSTKHRKLYWCCSCCDEDVNATKCEECYGINIIRDTIFDAEIDFLEKNIIML